MVINEFNHPKKKSSVELKKSQSCFGWHKDYYKFQ